MQQLKSVSYSIDTMKPEKGSENENVLKELTKEFDGFTQDIDKNQKIWIYPKGIFDFKTGNKQEVKVGEIGVWSHVKFVCPQVPDPSGKIIGLNGCISAPYLDSKQSYGKERDIKGHWAVPFDSEWTKVRIVSGDKSYDKTYWRDEFEQFGVLEG